MTKSERRKEYYQRLINAGFHYKDARILRDRGKVLIDLLINLSKGDNDDQKVLNKILQHVGCGELHDTN